MNKATWVALALAVSLALGATPAAAVTCEFVTCIGAGDFAVPFGPPPSYGPTSSQFIEAVLDPDTLLVSFNHIADLEVNVWQVLSSYIGLPPGPDVFYYGLTLTPLAPTVNISLFGTAFAAGVQGLITADGSAGWSWSNAVDAGGAGDAFDFQIGINDEGNLTWKRLATFWDNQQPITFYFTSSLPWGEGDTYSLTNSATGETVNTAPGVAVPEPSSLLLLGSGLLAFGFVRRSFRQVRE